MEEGLCPGNRLRILNSYDSGCFSPSPASSPTPSLAASTVTLNSSICSAEYENSSIISGTGSGNGSICGSANGSISASQTYLNQPQPQTTQQQQTTQFMQQQRQGTRRSWHVSPNKVITPQRHGDVYIYNFSAAAYPLQQQQNHSLPPQTNQQQQQIYSNQNIYQNLIMSSPATNGSNEFETYDIPKPATPVNYDCPRNVGRAPGLSHLRYDLMSLSLKGRCATPIQEESYDVPRPLNTILQHQNTLTPSSSNSSLLTSDSLSLSFSSSNRSSLANMPDYDVPRRNPMPVRGVHQLTLAQQQQQLQLKQQQNLNGNCMTYDFPLPTTQLTPVQEKPVNNAATTFITKELPLELSSALETLAKFQSEATGAITRLLSFVSPSWRLHEKLEPVIIEVELAAVRLRTALHDLTEFGEGALGNATRSEDRNLALKLRPLVRALRDANKLVHESTDAVVAQGGWTIDNLARNDEKSISRPPDSLDQLIACAQTLTEDVRQTTSFIQGNASLLFKRNIPQAVDTIDGSCTPTTNTNKTNSGEWLEDYDYVSFESKDAAAKKNSELREVIAPNLKKNFDTVIKAAEVNAMAAATNSLPNSKKDELTDKDKMLVRYYAVQISTHMGNLRQAIDSFLETVEKNQPPKFFIAYGKFVVFSAHNLVTIGDIVTRNVSKVELRDKIHRCTNALCDALKICVNKSKKAAAHFPSVTAVQEMVDSVVDISHLAADLKTAMLHTVSLTV
ncbi:breast cancer anti-estrogen resistance protein 1-like isoform X2 [Teleopsis dalmanni]|uniref:breast cancer anti-estrogen resistance protein 1-like isoform X2 n=1 Tax=Teleopsis dalmanni TaxID=139649 RepID=UPI0018CDA261|nr:breast cancer anti-estrogen resistance protein 1-like isoform X2 [Teleopsis dalmanni]